MTEFFYNFALAGENRGFSYLFVDPVRLYSFTRFRLVSDEVITNAFTLKLRHGEVRACKHNNLDWINLNTLPPNYFPSCAYPLLLPRTMKKPFTYVQISDEDASIIGETQLKRDLNVITESKNGTIHRTFTMDGMTPVRIDWGGAVSHLCSDGEESVRDSGLSFTME